MQVCIIGVWMLIHLEKSLLNYWNVVYLNSIRGRGGDIQ